MNPLRRIRIERDVSLRELAALSGVSQTTISRLEMGHQKAYGATLYKLAKALDVPLETFDDLLDTTSADRGKLGGEASKVSPKENRDQSLNPVAVYDNEAEDSRLVAVL